MYKSNMVDIKVPANNNNFSEGRDGRKIEMITIHHMAGVLTAQECGKIFQNPQEQASSHYGIGKDGKIGLYVDENNTAYTNGDYDSNCKSVTIEVSNSKTGGEYPVSDEVLSVLIKLVADIAKRNKLGVLVKGKNVTWHKMYSNTACPGKYLLGKMDYIIEEANKINNINENTNKKSDEEIAKEVIQGKWGNGKERKDRLEKAGYDYNKVQQIVNSILL